MMFIGDPFSSVFSKYFATSYSHFCVTRMIKTKSCPIHNTLYQTKKIAVTNHIDLIYSTLGK